MRANYEVPKEVREIIIKELYTYWKNIEKLEQLKEQRQNLIDSSAKHDITGISSKYKISNPTESKAIKLAEEMSTRAYIRASERIDYIKKAMELLSQDEQEVVEYIFKERCSQKRAEIVHYISKDSYYNIKNKIIYLTAIEFGEI